MFETSMQVAGLGINSNNCRRDLAQDFDGSGRIEVPGIGRKQLAQKAWKPGIDRSSWPGVSTDARRNLRISSRFSRKSQFEPATT
jgi:hypothetical protein